MNMWWRIDKHLDADKKPLVLQMTGTPQYDSSRCEQCRDQYERARDIDDVEDLGEVIRYGRYTGPIKVYIEKHDVMLVMQAMRDLVDADLCTRHYENIQFFALDTRLPIQVAQQWWKHE